MGPHTIIPPPLRDGIAALLTWLFQIPQGYPGAQPYGFYTLSGILFQGNRPDNYNEPAPSQPPFPGSWGMLFPWSPAPGQWRPTADLSTGSNLLNWAMGFVDRFRLGK